MIQIRAHLMLVIEEVCTTEEYYESSEMKYKWCRRAVKYQESVVKAQRKGEGYGTDVSGNSAVDVCTYDMLPNIALLYYRGVQ